MSENNFLHQIIIDTDEFSLFNEFINAINNSQFKFFLIADKNTEKYCLPLIKKFVKNVENSDIIVLNNGESFKNINTCIDIWRWLLENGADRDSIVINLGGGVISDIGGFVASTIKRGIKFINIPTTLMSMVDASLGGKNGIDISNIKNQIGLYTNPYLVVVSPVFLKTLPERHIVSGFAEMLKYALIDNVYLWYEINKDKGIILNVVNKYIAQCIDIKMNIVSKDFYETGERKILNFGHTFGHAIESYYLTNNINSLLHGEALYAGIILESFLSYNICGLKKMDLNNICDLIFSLYKLPLINKEDFIEIIKLISFDKKNKNGAPRFSLISNIGESKYNIEVNDYELKRAVDFYINITK